MRRSLLHEQKMKMCCCRSLIMQLLIVLWFVLVTLPSLWTKAYTLTQPLWDIQLSNVGSPNAMIPKTSTVSNPVAGSNQRRYHRFFELQEAIQNIRNDPKNYRKLFNTAYSRATVVDKAPWLTYRRMCKETCCVQAVAYSLAQDQHQLIHSRDGVEVADLQIPHYGKHQRKFGDFLKFHAKVLHEGMLPCLVPGTIIDVENHDGAVKYFFNVVRPQIQVPYVLMTTGSDGDTPLHGFAQHLGDPLLLKWYGTNPKYHEHPTFQKHRDKFQPMMLGLSRFNHDHQESNLLVYTRLNNFTNPFLNKDYWDLSKRALDFDKDVFVHFGLQNSDHRRKALWSVLCPATSTHSGSSCNQETEDLLALDIYNDMSGYRFGVSPVGLGYDCYRHYEMLLLGIIPIIEERDPAGYDLFDGLPVIHMPNMIEASSKQQFVDAIQNYIESDKFQKANFEAGWERLFLKYVRRQVLHDTGRDKEILIDDQGKEYYQAYHYTAVGEKNNKQHGCSMPENCKVSPTDLGEGVSWSEQPIPQLEGDDKKWVETWWKLGQQHV
jgi:hypothetical protein